MRKRNLLLIILLVFSLFYLIACDSDNSTDATELANPSEALASTDGDRSSSHSETDGCKHVYSSDCDAYCDICEAERTNVRKHLYDSDATCEDIVCTICSQVKKQDHDYVGKNCSKCNAVRPYELPENLGMPMVYLSDYIDGETAIANLKKADGEIAVRFKYVSNSEEIEDFECVTKIKIQGASSAYHPKKNFTVKLFEDDSFTSKFKVDLGWGKENKYCMKANYIDASHARNIIGARLAAQVTATRTNIAPGLAAAPNYGLIDGYPILVFINNYFYGIYTMNIPKDDWQFAMNGGEESKEAILMAGKWTDSVKLAEPIGESFEESGWEVEHCSTVDQTWIRDSFNELIELLNCGDEERIRAELPEHLDIEAAIDNFIVTYAINAVDNLSKNILWVTYDGKVWIPSMYDMDATFGMWWEGTPIGTPDTIATKNMYPSITEDGSYSISLNSSMVQHIIIQLYADELEARWSELRQEIITVQNVSQLFNEFFALIHDDAFYLDSKRWPNIPYFSTNRTNMYKAFEEQLARVDAFCYNFNKQPES